MGKNKDKTIEVYEERAIVYLPKDAIEVTIGAKLYLGKNKITDVEKNMDMHEIREAFRKAEEGYIDDDDQFVLTEKSKEYFENVCIPDPVIRK